MKTSIDIFIAYSHNDLIYKDQLKKFMRPLLNSGQVKVWDDRDIEAGREWEAEIKERLYGADVILLLVSPDSLDSDYFYGKEVEVSLQRHTKGEAVVVPVILRPCLWEDTPISILEALPTKAKPVTQWPSQDEAFTDVAKSLGKITKRLLEQNQQLKDIEEQRRQYAAAAKAADHLYAQQRWSEARKAYTDALALWQSSFEPASTTLQGRIAECDQALQREADYVRHIDNARRHLQRQAWPKAAAEAALALRLKPGDEPALQLQQQATNIPVRENTPLAPTRIYVLVAVLAVIVVAVAIWAVNRGNDKTSTPQTLEENTQPTESDAYTQARTQGTIPAWRNYLNTYPGGQYHADAQKELSRLEQDFSDKLNDAQVQIDIENYAAARRYLNAALIHWPDNQQAKSLLQSIENK
ncbi:MAG: TIR domain-containing protein [Saprospiraceae bacterium]|nr:TIR domain-containing protein [Saprospiraceae bacterium]